MARFSLDNIEYMYWELGEGRNKTPHVQRVDGVPVKESVKADIIKFCLSHFARKEYSANKFVWSRIGPV
jgi:hypothetical protein